MPVAFNALSLYLLMSSAANSAVRSLAFTNALAVFCQAHSNRLFRGFRYVAYATGLLFLI